MQHTLGTFKFEITVSQNLHQGESSIELMLNILFTNVNKESQNILGHKAPW